MIKVKLRLVLLSVLLGSLSNVGHAQKGKWDEIGKDGIVSSDTIKKKGYTLIFINKDATFDPTVKARMISTFFDVYPKEAKIYNKNTRKKVIIFIDPAYTAVAATAGEIVRVNPEWMHKHPEDIDVVTHEVMHIVQSYPGWAGPGWVTEGIADYVRATLGVDNKGANWTLPDYKPTQNYDNAYRVTARFFIWVEKNKKKGMVKILDNAMRTKTYTPEIWVKETGKTVDELWAEYGKNSVI